MSSTYELFESRQVTPSNSEAFASDMATFSDGRSVVVWDDRGDVRLQYFDQFGKPSGDTITLQGGKMEAATVTVLSDNSVIVAYTNYTTNVDGSLSRSWAEAQHFNADGAAVGNSFRLADSGSYNLSFAPSVEALPGGGFAYSLHRFNEGERDIAVVTGTYERGGNGSWSGSATTIRDTNYNITTDILTLANGEVAVALSNSDYVSRFDAIVSWHGNTANLPVTEFELGIISPGTTFQYAPNLAVGDDGRVMASWTTAYLSSGSEIQTRLIDPQTGQATFGTIVAHSWTSDVGASNVHAAPGGGYLVSWADYSEGEIYARLMSSDGVALGGEIQLTSNDSSADIVLHDNPEIASYRDDGLAMIWETDRAGENTGDVYISWFGILPELAFLSDGNDTAVGNNSADLIDLGDGKDHYSAGAGYDIVKGGVSADYIHGGNGWDRLFGERGTDELWGGRGNDELNGGDKADYLNGGLGHDRLFGGHGDDELWGKNGKDFLFGGIGDDLIFGNSGNDELGGGDGDDTLNGGHGQDILLGHDGNDVLNASNGADFLDGGLGDDVLTGGAGKDVFKFGSGADQISDFDTSRDRLLLDASLIGGAPDADDFSARAQVVGGDIVFSFDDGHSLTLIGVTDINLIESRIDIF